MAQSPDITDTFVREVDENMRRDRARDFFREKGGWIAFAVILFLAASAGFIWYQQQRQQRAEAQVEQLAKIYRDVGAGNLSLAPGQLDQLSNSSSDGVRATAMLTRAALALQQNDTKLAIATYKKIAEDGSLAEPHREAALIRQTALEFDQLPPQQVIARLEPLTKPGEPWFGSAGEMTALALAKQGKRKEAAQLFAQIAKDNGVPESLRSRAEQISGSLNVAAGPAGAAKPQ